MGLGLHQGSNKSDEKISGQEFKQMPAKMLAARQCLNPENPLSNKRLVSCAKGQDNDDELSSRHPRRPKRLEGASECKLAQADYRLGEEPQQGYGKAIGRQQELHVHTSMQRIRIFRRIEVHHLHDTQVVEGAHQ